MSISLQPNTQITYYKSPELPIIYSAYENPKLKIQNVFPEEDDRTQQSFKDECDINNIMAQYQRTGIIDFVNENEARYADATGIEYQASMELVANAHSMFEQMPAKLREHFDNDPGEFLEFASNPANKKEMAELGLLNPAAAAAILNPVPTPPEPIAKAPEASKEPPKSSD